MTIARQICDALCGGFTARAVPIGFAIKSPFDWFTGDKMIFYARTKGALVRFEDSGSTLFELEGAGVDLNSSTRMESLRQLCSDAGVTFDEEDSHFFHQLCSGRGSGVGGDKVYVFYGPCSGYAADHKVASS